MLVEVGRKAYLASIVPVIVNAILNEHQIIVDIVAFVNRGDFPRSRLGEKQRGKILAGWVSRKMRTIAQFAIRDMDPTHSNMMMGIPEGDSPSDGRRASYNSFRNSSIGGIGLAAVGSTLRNMEPAPQILEQRELESQLEHIAAIPAVMPGNGHRQQQQQQQGQPRGSYDSDAGQHAQSEITPTGPPAHQHGFDLPDFGQFDTDSGRQTPPGGVARGVAPPPEIRLPGQSEFNDVEWRPHQQQGPLRARNASITEDDWMNDAVAQMDLADGHARGQ